MVKSVMNEYLEEINRLECKKESIVNEINKMTKEQKEIDEAIHKLYEKSIKKVKKRTMQGILDKLEKREIIYLIERWICEERGSRCVIGWTDNCAIADKVVNELSESDDGGYEFGYSEVNNIWEN